MKKVFIILGVLLVLILSAFNFSYYFTKQKVLGANTESVIRDKEIRFWRDFLDKNPDYIPGWVEIGRLDRVTSIDPNYEIGVSN